MNRNDVGSICRLGTVSKEIGREKEFDKVDELRTLSVLTETDSPSKLSSTIARGLGRLEKALE